jgi:hypothetical protein
VQALNSSGKGEWSEVAILTTGTPKPPTDLTLLSASAASLQLAWTGDPSIRSRHCSYTLEMNRADSADGKPLHLHPKTPQPSRADSAERAERAGRSERGEGGHNTTRCPDSPDAHVTSRTLESKHQTLTFS